MVTCFAKRPAFPQLNEKKLHETLSEWQF